MSKKSYAWTATFYDANGDDIHCVSREGYTTWEDCYFAAADDVRDGMKLYPTAVSAVFVIASNRKTIQQRLNPAIYSCNMRGEITVVDYILPK